MGLQKYRQKRNFKVTTEPAGKVLKTKNTEKKLLYVIQKHAARRLHYDFRLELGGVLMSWAVPKGPSLDPHDKRLAVKVEDHPLAYGKFEGEIPEGEYGAGQVIIWDNGSWKPLKENFIKELKAVRLEFELTGKKLKGKWTLVKLKNSADGDNWLLIKIKDRFAKSGYDITSSKPASVVSRRRIDESRQKVSKSRKNVRKS